MNTDNNNGANDGNGQSGASRSTPSPFGTPATSAAPQSTIFGSGGGSGLSTPISSGPVFGSTLFGGSGSSGGMAFGQGAASTPILFGNPASSSGAVGGGGFAGFGSGGTFSAVTSSPLTPTLGTGTFGRSTSSMAGGPFGGQSSTGVFGSSGSQIFGSGGGFGSSGSAGGFGSGGAFGFGSGNSQSTPTGGFGLGGISQSSGGLFSNIMSSGSPFSGALNQSSGGTGFSAGSGGLVSGSQQSSPFPFASQSSGGPFSMFPGSSGPSFQQMSSPMPSARASQSSSSVMGFPAPQRSSGGLGNGFGTSQAQSSLFGPNSSGGTSFGPASTPVNFNASGTRPQSEGASQSAFSSTSGSGLFMKQESGTSQEPSAPPLFTQGSTNLFSAPAVSGAQRTPTSSSQPSSAPAASAPTVLSGTFPNLDSPAPASSGVSPAVSMAASVPIPNVSAAQTPQSSPANASRRSSEIRPDVSPAHVTPQRPAASTPVTSTPTSQPAFSFAVTTSAAPSARTTSALQVTQTSQAAETAATWPRKGYDVGAILHDALPTARAMEEDFHSIAERLAERDVIIVRRYAEIKKIGDEYEELMSRRNYCEREMQSYEAQSKHTREHAKTIAEGFEPYSAGDNQNFAFKAAFDQLYDDLVNADAALSEMENVIDHVYTERTGPIESRPGSNEPSMLDAEALMLEMRDIQARRAKLEEALKTI